MSEATSTLTFSVEHAGCESCAARLRTALAPVLNIDEIKVDAEADRAEVTGSADVPVSKSAVEAALVEASVGSGHTYSLSPGSWRSAG